MLNVHIGIKTTPFSTITKTIEQKKTTQSTTQIESTQSIIKVEKIFELKTEHQYMSEAFRQPINSIILLPINPLTVINQTTNVHQSKEKKLKTIKLNKQYIKKVEK